MVLVTGMLVSMVVIEVQLEVEDIVIATVIVLIIKVGVDLHHLSQQMKILE